MGVTVLRMCGRILAEGCRGDIHGAKQPAKRSCLPVCVSILNHFQCRQISVKASTSQALGRGEQLRFAGCRAP
jgi:hypothetical protein